MSLLSVLDAEECSDSGENVSSRITSVMLGMMLSIHVASRGIDSKLLPAKLRFFSTFGAEECSGVSSLITSVMLGMMLSIHVASRGMDSKLHPAKLRSRGMSVSAGGLNTSWTALR